jgi:hypothetical protein
MVAARLLKQYRRPVMTTHRGIWDQLTAILYGEPHTSCRNVLVAIKRQQT